MNPGNKNTRLRLQLGYGLWILCGQYFLIEEFVERAWSNPAYSFRYNTISDLGATKCPYAFPGTGMTACSPLHVFMNACFIENGLLIILGGILLSPLLAHNRISGAGLSMLGIGALGLIGVGLLPENIHPILHIISATWFFIISNVALVVLGIGIYALKERRFLESSFAFYTIASGAIAIGGLLVFTSKVTHLIGTGLVERIIGDPLTLWLVVIGMLGMIRSLLDEEKFT